MSNEHQNCRMLPLASSHLGNVAVCPNCGVLTVTIQCVSIRFEAPAFDELARMLGQARAALLRHAVACNGDGPELAEATEAPRAPRH